MDRPESFAGPAKAEVTGPTHLIVGDRCAGLVTVVDMTDLIVKAAK